MLYSVNTGVRNALFSVSSCRCLIHAKRSAYLDNQVEQLETTRHQVMSLLATTVQRSWRGYRFRQLLRIALAAKVCQNFWRSYICRRVFIRRLASQKIYSALLTFHCRRLFLSTRKATIVLQRGLSDWCGVGWTIPCEIIICHISFTGGTVPIRFHGSYFNPTVKTNINNYVVLNDSMVSII